MAFFDESTVKVTGPLGEGTGNLSRTPEGRRAIALAQQVQTEIQDDIIPHHFPPENPVYNLTPYQKSWGSDHRVSSGELASSGIDGHDRSLGTHMINALLEQGKLMPLDQFFLHVLTPTEPPKKQEAIDLAEQDRHVLSVFKTLLRQWYLDLKKQGSAEKPQYLVDLGYWFNPLKAGKTRE